MRPSSFHAFAAATTTVVLAGVLLAGSVEAQCITGPSALCGGAPVQLCGPSGNFAYEWTGPGFFYSNDPCITVSAPGTYNVAVFDMDSGALICSGSRSLANAPLPMASVSGPASVCQGSSASLAGGPSGNYSFAWSGPSGFSATTQNVSVSEAGTYELVVTDNATGCVSAPASHALSLSSLPLASISGPGQMCPGEAVDLCGPEGDFSFAWSGPGGMTAVTRCVNVSAVGSYQLVVTDNVTGCVSAPAIRNLASSPQPVASINGPSEACLGETVELCAPSGNFSAEWTGPGGFSSNALCVEANAGGTYRLVLTDLATGCKSEPVTHGLIMNNCQNVENCPKPSSFWRKASRNEERYAVTNLGAIARCVDDRANFFRWGSSPDVGFRGIMSGGNGSHAALAARQYAAVWANVCATDAGSMWKGRKIVLRPETPILLQGVNQTVAEWLAETDATLAALVLADKNDRAAKAAYREIIKVGMRVSHGAGIGPACGRGAVDPAEGGPEAFDAELEAELEAELAAELGESVMMGAVEPNPFSASARISFTVTAPADVQVGVFDLAGRQVRELARGSFNPGLYEVRWDGRDDRGGLARNGVYFLLTRVGGQKVQSRLTLLR